MVAASAGAGLVAGSTAEGTREIVIAPEIVIRQMAAEHQGAVNAISFASFNIAPGSGAVLPIWDDPEMVYFVACEPDADPRTSPTVNERVVGYVGLWMAGTEIHVSSIAVHPESRRRGIALSLLLHALDCGRRCAAARMTLEVRRPNAAARRLYHKLGFVAEGCRRRYYLDNGDDAVMMRLDDLQAPELFFRIRSLTVVEDGRRE